MRISDWSSDVCSSDLTFYNELDASAEEIVALIFITLGLFLVFVTLTWWSSGWGCFDFPRPDRATALFTGANKTAAVGIPLINTIYSGNPNLGLYTIPLLFYYSCQLLIGSKIGRAHV